MARKRREKVPRLTLQDSAVEYQLLRTAQLWGLKDKRTVRLAHQHINRLWHERYSDSAAADAMAIQDWIGSPQGRKK